MVDEPSESEIVSKECMRRADGAETLIKEGKTAFKGDIRVFQDGKLTVKALVENGVVVQLFAYPFDLNNLDSYLPIFEKIWKSGIFNDCVKAEHWIQKKGVALWTKFYGKYFRVLKENPVGDYVLISIDLEGFRKRAMP